MFLHEAVSGEIGVYWPKLMTENVENCGVPRTSKFCQQLQRPLKHPPYDLVPFPSSNFQPRHGNTVFANRLATSLCPHHSPSRFPVPRPSSSSSSSSWVSMPISIRGISNGSLSSVSLSSPTTAVAMVWSGSWGAG